MPPTTSLQITQKVALAPLFDLTLPVPHRPSIVSFHPRNPPPPTPGVFSAMSTANALIVPDMPPLPTLNPWLLASAGLLFALFATLGGIAFLAFRWATDWRHRPEILTGSRAWEAEYFGCEACGRKGTLGAPKCRVERVDGFTEPRNGEAQDAQTGTSAEVDNGPQEAVQHGKSSDSKRNRFGLGRASSKSESSGSSGSESVESSPGTSVCSVEGPNEALPGQPGDRIELLPLRPVAAWMGSGWPLRD